MPKYLITVILLIFLTLPVWAQEEEAAGEVADIAAGETEEATDELSDEPGEDSPEPEEDDIDDSDLDEQTYEEDDDDFIPTEEIPADEPIPFPSNI
jgi:hypothetical protein